MFPSPQPSPATSPATSPPPQEQWDFEVRKLSEWTLARAAWLDAALADAAGGGLGVTPTWPRSSTNVGGDGAGGGTAAAMGQQSQVRGFLGGGRGWQRAPSHAGAACILVQLLSPARDTWNQMQRATWLSGRLGACILMQLLSPAPDTWNQMQRAVWLSGRRGACWPQVAGGAKKASGVKLLAAKMRGL